METHNSQPSGNVRSSLPWGTILVAVLGLWLARGVLVLSQADVFGYEEFAKAELGRAMLDDLGVEHFRLAYYYYEIGGFAFSHLDALAFALLGESVLALKLVAIAWHSLVLALSMALAHAAYGRRAMAVAGLMLVLPPASLQKLSLLALGIHFESLLFHAWILLHAGRIAVEGSLRRRDLLGLGLACGLGASFNLTTLAASACAGLAVLLRARRNLGPRGWACLVGGALTGLLPWLWMASNVGTAILDLHGETLGSGSGSGKTLARLAAFWRMLWDERSLLDRADLLARTALFVWGAVQLLRGGGKSLGWTRLLLAHLSIFVAASLASGLVVGRVAHFNEFARPSPTWIPIVLVSAGGMAHWLEGPSAARRRLAGAAVTALAGFGLRALAIESGPVPVSRWGTSAVTLWSTNACALGKGVGYLYEHLEGERDERVAVLLRLSQPPRDRLEPAIAAAAIGKRAASLDEALELVRRMGGERWRNWALGLGELTHAHAGWDPARLPALLERFDDDTRVVLYEAAGRGHVMGQQLTRVEEDIAIGRRERMPEEWFVGVGWRLALLHLVSANVPYQSMQPIHPGYDHEAAREFLERQPPDVRPALERGWLRALEELRLRR